VGTLERSPGQEEVYDKLVEGVQEHGVQTRTYEMKAFYYFALYKGTTEENGDKLEINPEKPVAMEPW
jgi:hypothetical protein